MKLLKCISINITHLMYLINLYIETGIVPTILKMSRKILYLKRVIPNYY